MPKLLLIMTMLFSQPLMAKDCSDLLDFNVKTLAEKKPVNLCQYQGKVLLVVNTASRCAYTDQYDSLEKLYRKYKDRGLVVLGFPSNDFGNQEPGTEKEIKSFCRLTYSVNFPMFSKTEVRQGKADPFYKKLGQVAGAFPQWNFHKYLIDRDGQLVQNYRSSVDPLEPEITGKIESLISINVSQ